MKELTYRAVARPQARAAAIGGVRFDRIMALLSAWLIAGAYLDGWAHNHISDLETFFTPWHGILYSGFASAAGVLVSVVVANRVRGYPWREAVPTGYGYALLGTGLFAAAGVGDMIWHVMLGIESNIEALLSPTHIVLAFSAGLLVSGPFCAAWVRAGRGAATSWRTWFPAVLSLVLLEAVFTI